MYNQTQRKWEPSKKKVHFFKDAKNSKLYMVSSTPKVAVINKTNETPLTAEEGANLVNTTLQHYSNVDSWSRNGEEIIFVSPNIIKPSMYTIELVPTTFEEFKEYLKDNQPRGGHTINRYENISFTFEDDRFFAAYSFRRGKVGIEEINKNKLTMIGGLGARYESVMVEKENQQRSWGWSNRVYEPVRLELIPDAFEKAEINKVMVKFEDKLYPIKF